MIILLQHYSGFSQVLKSPAVCSVVQGLKSPWKETLSLNVLESDPETLWKHKVGLFSSGLGLGLRHLEVASYKFFLALVLLLSWNHWSWYFSYKKVLFLCVLCRLWKGFWLFRLVSGYGHTARHMSRSEGRKIDLEFVDCSRGPGQGWQPWYLAEVLGDLALHFFVVSILIGCAGNLHIESCSLTVTGQKLSTATT